MFCASKSNPPDLDMGSTEIWWSPLVFHLFLQFSTRNNCEFNVHFNHEIIIDEPDILRLENHGENTNSTKLYKQPFPGGTGYFDSNRHLSGRLKGFSVDFCKENGGTWPPSPWLFEI